MNSVERGANSGDGGAISEEARSATGLEEQAQGGGAGVEPEESSEPAPTGNDVDTEATAEKRKASAAAAEPEATPDDGSIPEFLRRDPPEQPVQP